MKKRLWIVLALVAVVGLMAWRLASNKQKIDAKKAPAQTGNILIPVNVDTIQLSTVSEQLMKTGTLVPWREADITATTSGTLQSVNFNLGSIVRDGAVVASIDNRALQLRLEGAQLQHQKFSKDYTRYQTLLAGEATTETAVQDIKYNLDNAVNQIAQIRKQMADNLIKSPVSGQIVAKNVEASEFVSPGTVLGRVVDISQLKVDVLINEADAYKLRTGQSVKVSTELFPGQAFDGTVIFISQQADAAHNYQVQVRLPNPSSSLKAGTFVSVDFIQPSAQPGIQIPRSALAASAEKPFVYLVENGKAVRRDIIVGRDLGNSVEVLSGLKAGDRVVVNGQINLANGSAVKVVG